MYKDDLLKRMVEAWGEADQIRQTTEECAELIVAISHWQRGRIPIEGVISELVDVSLMIDQMKYILGQSQDIDGLWATTYREKLTRAAGKLAEKDAAEGIVRDSFGAPWE